MLINLSAATAAIRKAGPAATRIVPMEGQSIAGQQQIEVRENGVWTPVAQGLSCKMASELVQQSADRLICG